MLTPISITNLSQGQIYGAKPTLEELEHQLAADPMTRAFDTCRKAVVTIIAGLQRMTTRKTGAARVLSLRLRRTVAH